MNTKLLLSILMLATLSSLVFAEECSVTIEEDTADEFFSNFASIAQEVQSCPLQLPGPAGTVYQNAVFNIVVTGDQERSFSAPVVDSKISSLSQSASDDPDYIVTMIEADLDAFLASDNKADTFMAFYNDGRIQINPEGVFNNLRYFVTWVASFFA